MSVSTVEVLQQAAELGLKLGIKEAAGKLTFEPVSRCPSEFIEVLKLHKSKLVALLRLPFVMVRSRTLDDELLFVCADDDTRAALIDHGARADEDAIYTRDELQILIEHNRARPFVPDELITLHDAKKLFNAKITPPNDEPQLKL